MTLMDATLQRRILCVGLALALFLMQLFIHVADDEQAENTALLHSSTTAAASVRTASTASHDKFGFYLMGDTPYRDWEESMLREQIDGLNAANRSHVEFMVHVGDFQKPDFCDEEHYQDVAELLTVGSTPTVIVPGDNDWYKCNDREQSLTFWRRHMTSLERSLPLIRDEEHPELFAFEKRGILFVSIHLVNGKVDFESKESWVDRMMRNEAWVAEQIQRHTSPELRAVFILGHSLRSPRTRPFFEALATNFIGNAERENLPVVYLHGDGHDWDPDHKFSHQLEWPQYIDLQIDQGAYADPCIVEIAKQVKGKHVPLRQEHDGQLLWADGLIRIDRQRGRYTDKFVKNFQKGFDVKKHELKLQKRQHQKEKERAEESEKKHGEENEKENGSQKKQYKEGRAKENEKKHEKENESQQKQHQKEKENEKKHEKENEKESESQKKQHQKERERAKENEKKHEKENEKENASA